MKFAPLVLVAATGLFAFACGYHVAGRETTLPKTIHVIAVPAIENKTSTYRIEQKLTAATIHEFLAKTKYKIVSNPESGDAVLTGKVLSVEAVPLTFQAQPASSTTPATAQATTMLVTVKCEVTLTESDTQKILFHADNFLFRNEYEIASASGPDPKAALAAFFEEQDPALDRLAKDFAQKLVAAVLENF
jgi:outer membrane lipopolysaccharide assembly protein LptE/RlpB